MNVEEIGGDTNELRVALNNFIAVLLRQRDFGGEEVCCIGGSDGAGGSVHLTIMRQRVSHDANVGVVMRASDLPRDDLKHGHCAICAEEVRFEHEMPDTLPLVCSHCIEDRDAVERLVSPKN